MNRRRYLRGMGTGIGVLTPVAGGSRATEWDTWWTQQTDTTLERAHPEDGITVQPGTTVLFEADVTGDRDPADILWYVGDEGPLSHLEEFIFGITAYDEYAAISPTLEAEGTYDIQAITQDRSESVTWSVTVDPDGVSPPAITEMTIDPGEGETVGVEDSIEITVSAQDPGGHLDRIIWYEPGNAFIVGQTALEGKEATGTLTMTPREAYWIERGYETVALAVSETGALSETASVPGPEVRPPFEVSILDTNDPVNAGEFLSVTAHVENAGNIFQGSDTQEIALVVGDEVVDTTTVSLQMGASGMVSLGYDTYPVEQDVTFPVEVRSPDHSDERTVEVLTDADPTLEVSIIGTNAPVQAGQVLEVDVDVTNTGTTSASGDVRLVVGDDQVDAQTVSVDGGATTTLTLGYETYPVRQDVSFPITVGTDDGSDRQTVDVHTADSDDDPSLSVRITGTNDPVHAGEFLSMTIHIENDGVSTATDTVELVVGGDVVDTQSVTVDPGSARVISLGYETYPVQQDVSFPVAARVGGDSDTRTVRVWGAGG